MAKYARVFVANSGRVYNQYHSTISVNEPDGTLIFVLRTPTPDEAEMVMNDLHGIIPVPEELPFPFP